MQTLWQKILSREKEEVRRLRLWSLNKNKAVLMADKEDLKGEAALRLMSLERKAFKYSQ
jgi:hypothetical protein